MRKLHIFFFWGGGKNGDPKRLRLPHLNGFQWFDVQDVITIVQWWLFIIEGWEAHALEVTSIALAKGRVQGDYGRGRFGNRGSLYYYIDMWHQPKLKQGTFAGKSLKMTIHLAASFPPKFKVGILQSLVAERWLESFSLVSHSRTGHGTGIFTYMNGWC